MTEAYSDFSTHPLDADSLHEECGVFGIIGHDDAAAHVALGLHALQHRGQEAAGIVSSENGHLYAHYAFGKVGENFSSASVIELLKGRSAIGHNRYSTSGGKRDHANIQPLTAEISMGQIAIAHNGNLTNAIGLKRQLVRQGTIFRTTMDTETVLHLIARSAQPSISKRVVDALKQVEGGYSLIVLAANQMLGVRDPLGIRPLMLGELDGAYILASETCAFDIIGANYIRDIKPGEMVVLQEGARPESSFPFTKTEPRFCIFEYVYFSRPDSVIDGRHVYAIRKRMGAELAKENKVDADLVVPVPDSGVPAALGYSEASGIQFDLGIIRNHYVGRTFIEPTDQIRHLGVKLKHNANRALIEGKRVILVDDSVVRGTTSKKIVDMVRAAGAKEVHLRISSPPTTDPCFYGVDTPSKDKLLASKMDVEGMAKFVGADSLAFLTVEGLYRAVGEQGRNATPQYCDACFTGDYPVAIKDKELTGSCGA